MGLVQNVIGIVRDIHAHQQDAKINDVLKANPNYLSDPTAGAAAVQQIQQIDPTRGAALSDQLTARHAASANAANENFGKVTSYLRMLPHDGSVDYGHEVDTLKPFFTQDMGLSDEQFGHIRNTIVANPSVISSLTPEAVKAAAKAQYGAHVLTPGSALNIGGKRADYVPYGYKTTTTRGGDGASRTDVFDPNTGQFVAGGAPAAPTGAPGAGTGGPLTAATLAPHIKAQESGGDYAARNASTGAMGAYQIMPPTGRTLAQRLGLPWRPDMMTKSDPASVKYQDAIGQAAVQEAVDHSGGNPQTAAMYYHGGSNENIWGPKTRQYAQDIVARLGGAARGGSASPTSIQMPGKAPKQTRAATPQEIAAAGYPAGTAAQVNEAGQFVNLKTPSGSSQQAAQAAGDLRSNALTMIQDMRDSLIKLRDDPALGSNTGIAGALTNWIPGKHSHYLEGLIQQINAGKLATLLTDLKANGNPLGNRILKVEVEQLPKLLANLSLSQNQGDFTTNINSALERLDAMEHKTRGYNPQAGARPAAGAGTAPKLVPGKTVYKGHVYLGGDPAAPTSWRAQ